MSRRLRGTSPVAQGLRLCASTAGHPGWIPGQRTKVLHEARCGQKKRLENFGYACTVRGLPRRRSGKESTCQFRRCRRPGCNPWVGKSTGGRTWQPTPVFLPGVSHGQRSLAGYSPRSHKESDTSRTMRHAGIFCSRAKITDRSPKVEERASERNT